MGTGEVEGETGRRGELRARESEEDYVDTQGIFIGDETIKLKEIKKK